MNEAIEEFLERGTLVIHLGAHKTATTYIQNALEAGRATLRAHGTGLILPVDLRWGRRAAPPGKQGHAPSLEAQFHELAKDQSLQRIVLSEENYLGSTGNNLVRKRLYPGIRRRLGKLPSALNHPNTRLAVSLRDYGTFLSSGVTTAVRRGKMFDPVALRHAFLLMHRSWIDVIEDVQNLIPAAQLTLWRYENFARIEAQVFRAIAGEFTPAPQERSFRTLSHAAMDHVQEILSSEQNNLSPRQVVRAAAREFPISEATPRFSLWEAEEAKDLTGLYDAHWQEICEKYPDSILPGG